jgi:hypothetical protein
VRQTPGGGPLVRLDIRPEFNHLASLDPLEMPSRLRRLKRPLNSSAGGTFIGCTAVMKRDPRALALDCDAWRRESIDLPQHPIDKSRILADCHPHLE